MFAGPSSSIIVFSAIPVSSEDAVHVDYKYTHAGIDGFELFRGVTSIGKRSIEEHDTAITNRITDNTGVPEQVYSYKLLAYSVRNGNTYYTG